MLKTLESLISTIRQKKTSPDEKSYTSKLLRDKNLSVEKVKEEIAELIEAVENNSNTVHEAADVLSIIKNDQKQQKSTRIENLKLIFIIISIKATTMMMIIQS